MMKVFMVFILIATAPLIAIAQQVWLNQRTWVFTEDGKIEADPGGRLSFKKGGRIDAYFVRLKGTNDAVLRLATDGKDYSVPILVLSDADRKYLALFRNESPGAALGREVEIQKEMQARGFQARMVQEARARIAVAKAQQMQQAANAGAADEQRKQSDLQNILNLYRPTIEQLAAAGQWLKNSSGQPVWMPAPFAAEAQRIINLSGDMRTAMLSGDEPRAKQDNKEIGQEIDWLVKQGVLPR